MAINSLFITIEGGEGAGKSTLLKGLAKAMADHGHQVMQTREPGGTDLGEEVRQWLLADTANAITPFAELLLFFAARAENVAKRIQPALNQGTWVLCDRFNDSTWVYQGWVRGLDLAMIEQLSHWACAGVMPNLTLLLDIEPEEGLMRTQRTEKTAAAAGKMDRIESEGLDFHRRVREGFLQLAHKEPQRFCVLDARQPAEVVLSQALEAIKHHSKKDEMDK